MTDQNNSFIKELSFEDHPIHVFEINGKIAFIALEVANILGIKDVMSSLQELEALEKSVDYDTIPTAILAGKGNFPFLQGNIVSVLYLSGFFLFVPMSNKPIAAPLVRWIVKQLTFGDPMSNTPAAQDGPTGKEALMGTDREEGRHD